MQKDRHGVRLIVQFLLGKHQQPTISQLDHISKVVGSIPSWVTAEVLSLTVKKLNQNYIQQIAPQVLELLEEDDPLLSASAAHIIAFLSTQHPALVSRDILSPVQAVFSPNPVTSIFGSGGLLSDDEAVRHSLKQLQLISSNSTPSLITALLSPILFNLFLLLVYTHGSHHSVLRSQVTQLLEAYLKYSSSPASGLLDLTRNLLSTSESHGWSFAAGETGGVAIHRIPQTKDDLGLDDIQTRVEVFMEISQHASEEVKSEVFVGVIKQWLKPELKDTSMRFVFSHICLNHSAFAGALLLQEFMTRHQSEIMKAPIAIIQVCVEILSHSLDKRKSPQPRSSLLQLNQIVKNEQDEEMEDGDDGMVDMALSLLSGVTADSVQRDVSSAEISALESCLSILEKIAIKDQSTQRRNQARNIISFIRARIAMTRPSTEPPPTSDEDIYSQAMEYIADPLVPVRAQGISLLRDLILRKSSAVDLNVVFDTLIGTLQDDDSYVYLNAIKAIRSLAEIHGNRLLDIILEKYESPSLTTDVRLRLAEVVAGLIQQMGQLFTGAVAESTISKLLNLVSTEKDWRVKVSAIGLLSVCIEIALSMAEPVIEMALHLFRVNDLTFAEDGEEAAPLRRGAVTVIGAVLRGGGVDALGRFTRDVVRSVRYLARSDGDDTVKDLARGVLNMLGGAIEDNSLAGSSDNASRWKII